MRCCGSVYNMFMLRKLVVLVLLASISTSFFACNVEPEQPTPATASSPAISARQEHINLDTQSWRRSAMHADAGNRVEVTIEIWQQKGGYTRCGEPLVRGVTGDILASSSLEMERQGAKGFYRYEFVAAETGQYTVELHNQGCRLTNTPATAIVTWTVHKAPDLVIP